MGSRRHKDSSSIDNELANFALSGAQTWAVGVGDAAVGTGPVACRSSPALPATCIARAKKRTKCAAAWHQLLDADRVAKFHLKKFHPEKGGVYMFEII